MKPNFKLVTSFWFLIGLLLLLLNDFVFKSLYGNWLTGKLSDIAGLFIFPLFWSALFPKYKNKFFWITGILFVVWKSIFSQVFIDSWNQWNILTINRVVDYTDLIALFILPVSYAYEQRIERWNVINMNPIFPLLISAFSFMATSKAPPNGYIEQTTFGEDPLKTGQEFKIEERKISFSLSKKEFLRILQEYEVIYPFKIKSDSVFFAGALDWQWDNLKPSPAIKIQPTEENHSVVLVLRSVIYDSSFINKTDEEMYNPVNKEIQAKNFELWFVPKFSMATKIDSLNVVALKEMDKEEYETAIATFNQLIQFSPQWTTTRLMFHNGLGNCYVGLKDYKTALIHFYKADSLNKLYSSYSFRPEPYMGLSKTYEQLNEKDSVMKYKKIAADAKEWTKKKE
jgi:hypothetical protein